MSFDQFLENANDFLLNQTGMVNAAFQHTTQGKNGSVKSLFFQPYQSKSDLMYRTTSIVTAPACLSIIALELAVASVYMGLKFIANLAMLDTSAAKAHAKESLIYLAFSFVTTVAAIMSPMINLVDMTGSCFSSIKHNDEIPQEMQFN